ncbi:hypothetical protein DPMN_090081 [Dreissena polymorpha]|uniref:Uncharacterized protein n=1 Tax=Dreissena polymorpha TaxID=45954 RepID=A0A9D4KXL0_DREPO|nr:hypothetical protein DPMN_090081 [Dreissena polymorpha]
MCIEAVVSKVRTLRLPPRVFNLGNQLPPLLDQILWKLLKHPENSSIEVFPPLSDHFPFFDVRKLHHNVPYLHRSRCARGTMHTFKPDGIHQLTCNVESVLEMLRRLTLRHFRRLVT